MKKEFFCINVRFFFHNFYDESFSEPKVNWMWNYDSYHCESLLSNYIRYWLVVDVGPRATFQKKWGRNQKVLLVKKVVCPRLQKIKFTLTVVNAMIHSPIKSWLIHTAYQKDLRKKYLVTKSISQFLNPFLNTLFQLRWW